MFPHHTLVEDSNNKGIFELGDLKSVIINMSIHFSDFFLNFGHIEGVGGSV